LQNCPDLCRLDIGSFDELFKGRAGAGASLMSILNNPISGAIAFRRRGV